MAAKGSAIVPNDPANGRILPLEPGDTLTRAEFERRYDAMHHLKKAELVEVVGYMPSPVRFDRHGKPHAHLIGWLVHYEAATPGVATAANVTIRLDLDNEPQPDGAMFIDPACGGQARIDQDDYLCQGPALVVEVSACTASFDLNTKLHVYRRNQVAEYLVWRVLDKQVDWFGLREGRFVQLPLDSQGRMRSTVFPGLWLDPAALVRGDIATALAVVQEGLASPEHAAFVTRLNASRRP